MRITVNGAAHELDVPASRTLAELLRTDLALTGTKESCAVGVCGACTVLVDGRIVASCITLAAQVADADIVTVEGLASEGRLHPLQQSFIDHGGFQCGICTPGQIVAAKALLDQNAAPTEDDIREWMSGNLCRCTGYYQIIESIAAAAAAGAASGD